MISPPQTAAGLLALIAAGVGTWVTSGHQSSPAREPSPVAMSFAALEKSDKLIAVAMEPLAPRIVKAIPIPKAGTPEAAELFLATEKPVLAIKTNMSEREERAVQAKNICERSGGNRVEFSRHHHTTWRCVYPHKRHRHRSKAD